MRLPYERARRRQGSLRLVLPLALLTALIFFGWTYLSSSPPEADLSVISLEPGMTPTVPERRLTMRDVLPTPTADQSQPPRTITFPGALLTSRVIEAVRTESSWETRYLGDAVGHLQNTSWLGGAGGNIVLAGHVETAFGEPGPFAYLFEAVIGDQVILRDGEQERIFQVVSIEEAPPDEVSYVIQDGKERLTLITCTNWNQADQTYLGRLVVIAEPVPSGG